MKFKVENDKAKVITDEICNSGAINDYEIDVDYLEMGVG